MKGTTGFPSAGNASSVFTMSIGVSPPGDLAPNTTARSISILVACQPGECAAENIELGHGLFTACLLRGLGGGAVQPDGQITVQSSAPTGLFENSSLLLGSTATRNHILRAVFEAGQGLTTRDLLLLYFSGHGVEVAGETVLLPHDAVMAEPALCGVRLVDLAVWWKPLAFDIVVLLDCSHRSITAIR